MNKLLKNETFRFSAAIILIFAVVGQSYYLINDVKRLYCTPRTYVVEDTKYPDLKGAVSEGKPIIDRYPDTRVKAPDGCKNESKNFGEIDDYYDSKAFRIRTVAMEMIILFITFFFLYKLAVLDKRARK